MTGVVDQVEDHAPELLRDHANRWEARLEFGLDGDAATPTLELVADQSDVLRDDRLEPGLDGLAAALTRVREHRADDAVHALAVLVDLVQIELECSQRARGLVHVGLTRRQLADEVRELGQGLV